mgnify:CR=1 FL=1
MSRAVSETRVNDIAPVENLGFRLIKKASRAVRLGTKSSVLPPEFGENLRTHRGRCRTRDNGRTVRLVAADSENGFDSLPPKPCTIRLLSAALCCLLFFRHRLFLMVAHGKGFVKVFGEKSRGLTTGAPRRIIFAGSLFAFFAVCCFYNRICMCGVL